MPDSICRLYGGPPVGSDWSRYTHSTNVAAAVPGRTSPTAMAQPWRAWRDRRRGRWGIHFGDTREVGEPQHTVGDKQAFTQQTLMDGGLAHKLFGAPSVGLFFAVGRHEGLALRAAWQATRADRGDLLGSFSLRGATPVSAGARTRRADSHLCFWNETLRHVLYLSFAAQCCPKLISVDSWKLCP